MPICAKNYQQIYSSIDNYCIFIYFNLSIGNFVGIIDQKNPSVSFDGIPRVSHSGE